MKLGLCVGVMLAISVLDIARAELLPIAHDLDSDAAQAAAREVPIVIMFSSDECPYCDLIARYYLGPLAADPATAERAVIRMVKDDATPIVDFAGVRMSHAEFSARQGVQLVPTLRFFSSAGERLADDLVGVGVEDFYLAYLYQRLDQAHTALLSSGN
jgi:thioredoxin-related protein